MSGPALKTSSLTQAESVVGSFISVVELGGHVIAERGVPLVPGSRFELPRGACLGTAVHREMRHLCVST